MADRTVLHVDMNCFYASVEMLHRPQMRNVPMAVGGDPQARHGIVLTANYLAKRQGVKTGMALWQARQVCPDIQFVPLRMDFCICVFLGWHMRSIRNIQTFGNHTAAMRSGWMCQEAVLLWEMGLRLLRISVAELSQS